MIIGSIDMGTIFFFICVLCSVLIIYPAYVRAIHYSSNIPKESLYIGILIIVLTTLISGLAIFPSTSIVPSNSRYVGIIITYIGIGCISVIFGYIGKGSIAQDNYDIPDVKPYRYLARERDKTDDRRSGSCTNNGNTSADTLEDL